MNTDKTKLKKIKPTTIPQTPSLIIPQNEIYPPIPLETLPEQLPHDFFRLKLPNYTKSSGNVVSYCVGIVDMVGSSKISYELGIERIPLYYEIFLNTMARIINRYGGMIIKNIGDSLLFYFPESSKGRRFGFMTCLEGSLAMIDAHDFICGLAKKEQLPPINYRVSCDYGSVIEMTQMDNNGIDMLGTPLNMCSKINRMASLNEAVIGENLYKRVKNFKDYKFSLKGMYKKKENNVYSVHSVQRK